MNPYQTDTFEYPMDRSPNSMRGYNNGTVQRQSSRHFGDVNYAGAQGLYTAEDHNARRYDPAPQDYRGAPPTIHASHYNSNTPYDNQTWSYGAPSHGGNAMGGTGRMKPPSRRAALPTQWDAPIHSTAPQFGLMGANGLPHNLQHPQHHHSRHSPPLDQEDLIPTAIVIKNIPFAVKKEQLQSIMTDMHLPLPYAFNYHFDGGVFRGLAFANFTTAEETTNVINVMNGMELSGRKLRVEYKKMLPVAERDRIERDKRERRGQLQEQHQPIQNGQLHNQGSMNSLNSNIPATSPSPISQRTMNKLDVDLNDPNTLEFYTALTLFKNDPNRESYVFPNQITPAERRTIHTLAHHMGLEHRSEGSGEYRQVQILKHRPTTTNPILPQISSGYYNESRRGLNRAATVDFTENRAMDSNYNEMTLRRQGSTRLDVPSSPGTGGGLLPTHSSLRAAKSFADLRSYSPSPSLSNGSFPTSLTHNVSKYQADYHNTGASGTPTLTPTSAGGMNSRDEQLINSMANIGIRDDRTIVARQNYTPAAGPIGSQRPVNGNYDETARNGASAVPQRQPKGPSGNEWGQSGFNNTRRQNGHMNRGSDSSDRSTATAGRPLYS